MGLYKLPRKVVHSFYVHHAWILKGDQLETEPTTPWKI